MTHRTVCAWALVGCLLGGASVAVGGVTGAGYLDGVEVQKLIVVGTADGTPPDSSANHVDANVSTSAYAGVGSIRVSLGGGSYYLGSGVLISPYHVLTAGHLIDTNDDGTIDHAASSVQFYLNSAAAPTIITADALAIHPDYTGFDNPVVNDDLAIITLSAPVAAGVPIYPLYTGSVTAGTQTIQVGYGRTGDGVVGYTTTASLTIKRVGSNIVDLFEEDDDQAPGNDVAEVWLADFDGPTDATNLFAGLTLGNDVETALGPGDSGGPSFIDVGGQLYVVGLDTLAFSEPGHPNSPLFGSGFGGVLVEPYLDWIDSVVPEPGTMGLVAAGMATVVVRRRKA